MSQRLWTPLHDWLSKLGLCKPFCLSKIQCSKLKSPVSLWSSVSQLGREEGEWRFSHLPPGVFFKCHNQLFSYTSPFLSSRCLFTFFTTFIPSPNLCLPPIIEKYFCIWSHVFDKSLIFVIVYVWESYRPYKKNQPLNCARVETFLVINLQWVNSKMQQTTNF